MTRAPLQFVRQGLGFVGTGAVERVEFAGDAQIADAASWWRTRAASLPPSAVAFGAFAFDPVASSTPGVLLLPERVDRVDATPAPARAASAGAVSGDPVSSRPGDIPPAAYEAAVAAAVAAIRRGEVEKVVIARDVLVRGGAAGDPAAVLSALDRGDPRVAVFAVDGMIGASPETLVSVRDGRFRARVLAGTAPAGQGAALLASAKDRAEHVFAVASVLDALGGHVREVVSEAEPFALELPQLTHLATDVTGIVADDSSVLDLVAALHPTAAVAGTPTAAAIRLIRELEPFDRGRYAGPVGWVDAAGDGEWAIALRCARVEPDGAMRAYAGAGIVADSNPAAELAETELKLRAILDAIGGASGR